MALLIACNGDSPAEELDPLATVIPAVETKVSVKASLVSSGRNELIDGAGRVWVNVGPVKTTTHLLDTNEANIRDDSKDSPHEPDLTAEQLAENLRPVRVQDGQQYILKDAPIELAREILRMKVAGQLAPSIPGNAGSRNEVQSVRPGGELKSQHIIGSEQRYSNSLSTGTYPYRATGKWENISCTGFFVGPRTVVTSAHCFYSRATKEWGEVARFIPGKHDSYEPWGRWSISTYYIPTAYMTDALGWDYDFGVADLTIAPGYSGSPGGSVWQSMTGIITPSR